MRFDKIIYNNRAAQKEGFGRVPDPDIPEESDDDIYDPKYDRLYVPEEQNKIGALDFLKAWVRVCKEAKQDCDNCPIKDFCIADELYITKDLLEEKAERLPKFVRACMVNGGTDGQV